MSPWTGRILLLISVVSVANTSRAEIWKPFGKKEPPANLAPTTPPAPLGVTDHPPRPLLGLERPKWPAMRRFPGRKEIPDRPARPSGNACKIQRTAHGTRQRKS